MSISLLTAQNLAEEKVFLLEKSAECDLVLLKDSTIEIEQGWIFFYNSKAFIESGDPISALAGNGPILVSRSGTIRELPSGVPWETALAIKD